MHTTMNAQDGKLMDALSVDYGQDLLLDGLQKSILVMHIAQSKT